MLLHQAASQFEQIGHQWLLQHYCNWSMLGGPPSPDTNVTLVLQFASTVVLDGHRSRAGVLLLRHKLTICSPIVQVCFVECFGIGWPWHWLRQVGMRVENWEVPWHKAPYSILDPTGFIRTLRVCYCVPLSVAWDHQEHKWPEYHHPIGQLQ